MLRRYCQLRPVSKKWAEKPAVIVYPDGREQCNLVKREGLNLYNQRIAKMVKRKHGRCCLEGICPVCPGRLSLIEATFEHEDGRTSGHRDDRIELPDGTWINGAAHRRCNQWKGSRYIPYNDPVALEQWMAEHAGRASRAKEEVA